MGPAKNNQVGSNAKISIPNLKTIGNAQAGLSSAAFCCLVIALASPHSLLWFRGKPDTLDRTCLGFGIFAAI